MVEEQLRYMPELPAVQSDDSTVGSMPLAQFLASRFIPNHVQLKRPAGRTHYHAILKHVMTPELVDRLFAPYLREVNGRLKAVPGWPYLDQLRIGDITPEHVRQLTSSAAAHGYSHQTIKHIRNVVGMIFIHARKERVFYGENPVSEVKLQPPSSTRRPQLSAVQANAILNLMEAPEREIALIAMYTGLKIPEICALQWKHIKIDRARSFVDGTCIPPGFIFVSKQWIASGIVDLGPGRIRGVSISPSLARALIKMRQKKMIDPESYVISHPDGCPVSPSVVRLHRLKLIVRELGLPWVSWQVLRQSYKSRAQELRPRPGNTHILGLKLPETASEFRFDLLGGSFARV
jgi:integrase